MLDAAGLASMSWLVRNITQITAAECLSSDRFAVRTGLEIEEEGARLSLVR